MLYKHHGYLVPFRGEAPVAAEELHRWGFAVLEGAFTSDEVAELRAEIDRAFAELPPDGRPAAERRDDDMFRYEMLNRSAACQRAVANPRVLETIEPLLGADCHIIANTAWRNPPGLEGSERGDPWHVDAGPHVPRPPGVPWPDEIPYPVFAVGCHILLQDVGPEDGPTGVIPGSHRSGQHPPFDRSFDPGLEYDGRACVPLLGRAGDVLAFVSDLWHRRMPTGPGEAGRYFLQAHYGRRDIAQRLKTTAACSQLDPAAAERARSPRERSVVGLHEPHFYDG